MLKNLFNALRASKCIKIAVSTTTLVKDSSEHIVSPQPAAISCNGCNSSNNIAYIYYNITTTIPSVHYKKTATNHFNRFEVGDDIAARPEDCDDIPNGSWPGSKSGPK